MTKKSTALQLDCSCDGIEKHIVECKQAPGFPFPQSPLLIVSCAGARDVGQAGEHSTAQAVDAMIRSELCGQRSCPAGSVANDYPTTHDVGTNS